MHSPRSEENGSSSRCPGPSGCFLASIFRSLVKTYRGPRISQPRLPSSPCLEVLLAVRSLRTNRGGGLDRFYLGNLGVRVSRVFSERDFDPHCCSMPCFTARGWERVPLFGEFGLVSQLASSEYARPRKFRENLDRSLDLVRAMWPQCLASVDKNGLGLIVDHATAVLPSRTTRPL
jgi:hypothetical protein